jgi:hypothetical protein
MGMMQASEDARLAGSLAKLWPHREHEAGPMRGFCCRMGLHRWRRLDLERRAPAREVRFCFWCSKVRIDGVVYEP